MSASDQASGNNEILLSVIMALLFICSTSPYRIKNRLHRLVYRLTLYHQSAHISSVIHCNEHFIRSVYI